MHLYASRALVVLTLPRLLFPCRSPSPSSRTCGCVLVIVVSSCKKVKKSKQKKKNNNGKNILYA